jgi:uncharacterized short protein YbdD (DUF466 family)
MLGYSDMKSFEKVLNRATKTMVSLNIPHYDNIIAVKRKPPLERTPYNRGRSKQCCF